MRIKFIPGILLAVMILFTACNETTTTDGNTGETGTTENTTDNGTDNGTTTDAPTNKKRENALIPKKKVVYRITSEDQTGQKMSEEMFNEQGHMTSDIDYDFMAGGKVLEEATYEYDAEGKKLKAVEKSMGITTTTIYTYNAEGHTSKEEFSTSKGEKGFIEYSRNDKGELSEAKFFDGAGTLTKTMVYEYKFDENGNITEEIRTEKFADGTEKRDYHVTMEYNGDGKLVKENLHNHETGDIISTETFAYDERGNEIENKEFNKDGVMIQRLTTEYNEYGDILKDEAYDSEGTKDFWTEYRYDEHGTEIYMMYDDQYGDEAGERVEVEYWK